MAGTLYFLCGKMAAGKSTLARDLAHRNEALLLDADALLGCLYPGEFTDLAAFLDRFDRLERALAPVICDLLSRGVPVVLDFPANTRRMREWFRDLIARTGASHELHFVDVSDEACKRQLRARSSHLPPGSPWTSDEEFDAVTAYFQPPADDEGFTVVRHVRP